MMKNNIKNIATVCIASITLLACNDWTDVENIKVNQPDVKEINSEQYAQYLLLSLFDVLIYFNLLLSSSRA